MTLLPLSLPGSLYLFPLPRSQQSMSEASCLCSWAVLPQKGAGTETSQRPCMFLPACPSSGMAGGNLRQTPFTLAFGAKSGSSQKAGDSGPVGLSLFARGLRAHKSCKPHLTLERHLIYAVWAWLYEVLSWAQGRALYAQTGSTLRTVGVFLQTSCFGPDGHLAARRVLLGFFQLRASWFEAPTEDLTRIYSVWGEHGHGHGSRILGERPKAFLGFICFCASQTGESVSGKKRLGVLATWSQGSRKARPHLSHLLGIWKLWWLTLIIGANICTRPSGSQGSSPCVLSHTQAT